jgi:hypothetical protein
MLVCYKTSLFQLYTTQIVKAETLSSYIKKRKLALGRGLPYSFRSKKTSLSSYTRKYARELHRGEKKIYVSCH